MKAKLTLTLEEAQELCAQIYASKLGKHPGSMDVTCDITIPEKSYCVSLNVTSNKTVLQANKVELIKLVREAEYRLQQRMVKLYPERATESWTSGLAEAKTFIETRFGC